MNYYQTDDEGYLIGGGPLDESPMEPGVYLLPRGGVLANPPSFSSGQLCRWTGTTWVITADRRGEPYWMPDGSQHFLEERGEAPPPLATPQPPPKSPAEIKQDATNEALKRVSALRATLADHIADHIAGTPAEQGQAKAAIGLLRAELAIEKAKLV